jgi:4-cresol dehydrogenase (hydroxylating)
VTELAERILLAHGFEPQMSISLATERASICVITISYDRSVSGEDERALACHEELMTELIARGYPPYRLGLPSMGCLDAEWAYGDTLRALKAALDPNGVVAPGRYEPVSRPRLRDTREPLGVA